MVSRDNLDDLYDRGAPGSDFDEDPPDPPEAAKPLTESEEREVRAFAERVANERGRSWGRIDGRWWTTAGVPAARACEVVLRLLATLDAERAARGGAGKGGR